MWSNNKIQSTHNPESWSLCVWMCECLPSLSFVPFIWQHNNTFKCYKHKQGGAARSGGLCFNMVLIMKGLQFFVSVCCLKWAPLPIAVSVRQSAITNLCLVTGSEQRSLSSPVHRAPGPARSGYIQLAPVHSGSGSVLAPEIHVSVKMFPLAPTPTLSPAANVIGERF